MYRSVILLIVCTNSLVNIQFCHDHFEVSLLLISIVIEYHIVDNHRLLFVGELHLLHPEA